VKLKGAEIDRGAAWRFYTLKPLPGTAVPKPPAGKLPLGKPPVSAGAPLLPPPPVVAKPPTPPTPTKCDFPDPFTGKCPP
jgi:hypothetical protein